MYSAVKTIFCDDKAIARALKNEEKNKIKKRFCVLDSSSLTWKEEVNRFNLLHNNLIRNQDLLCDDIDEYIDILLRIKNKHLLSQSKKIILKNLNQSLKVELNNDIDKDMSSIATQMSKLLKHTADPMLLKALLLTNHALKVNNATDSTIKMEDIGSYELIKYRDKKVETQKLNVSLIHLADTLKPHQQKTKALLLGVAGGVLLGTLLVSMPFIACGLLPCAMSMVAVGLMTAHAILGGSLLAGSMKKIFENKQTNSVKTMVESIKENFKRKSP